MNEKSLVFSSSKTGYKTKVLFGFFFFIAYHLKYHTSFGTHFSISHHLIFFYFLWNPYLSNMSGIPVGLPPSHHFLPKPETSTQAFLFFFLQPPIPTTTTTLVLSLKHPENSQTHNNQFVAPIIDFFFFMGLR